jgi:hypothetical protein
MMTEMLGIDTFNTKGFFVVGDLYVYQFLTSYEFWHYNIFVCIHRVQKLLSQNLMPSILNILS